MFLHNAQAANYRDYLATPPNGLADTQAKVCRWGAVSPLKMPHSAPNMRAMAISDTMQKAFNDQFNAELQAAMVYKQLELELDRLSLVGMRDWMHAHVEEEMGHAQKFADHVLARGGQVTVATLTVPELSINSARDAFEAALAHEKKVSELIRTLAQTADAEGDLDSRSLLNEFLAEQIEEEDTVSTILDRLAIVGEDGSGILRIDAELGKQA